MSPQTEQAAAKFLMRLAKALHSYGMPAHRVEEALAAVSEKLQLEAQWLVTPTSIVGSLGPFERSHTYLVRLDPGEVDLAKLSDLNELIREVGEGKVNFDRASERVDQIIARTPTFAPWVKVASSGVASGAAATFFDGGLNEVVVAALIGIAIALMLQVASRMDRLALVIPAIAGILASFIAYASGPLLGSLFPFLSTLAGLIVLLPGLTLTLAVSELAHRHLVSGSARLVWAFMTFLQIGFGVAIGMRSATWIKPRWEVTAPESFPLPIILVALLATSVALTVLFKARQQDLFVILISITAAYFGSRIGSQALGPELGALLGAFALGVVSNLLSKLFKVPAATPLLPGLLVLVPGSIGFRSLSALLENDVVGGLQSGFATILIAFSLVTGLLFANLVMKPRNLFAK